MRNDIYMYDGKETQLGQLYAWIHSSSTYVSCRLGENHNKNEYICTYFKADTCVCMKFFRREENILCVICF